MDGLGSEQRRKAAEGTGYSGNIIEKRSSFELGIVERGQLHARFVFGQKQKQPIGQGAVWSTVGAVCVQQQRAGFIF